MVLSSLRYSGKHSTIIILLQALPSGGPSPSQVHHDEEKDQQYLPLDHKKGGKGAGSKDKPSSTQGGSGEEYSALGNSKVRPMLMSVSSYFISSM